MGSRKQQKILEAQLAEKIRVEALVGSYASFTLSELCERLYEAEAQIKEIESGYDRTIKELEADNVIMSRQIQDMSVKIWNYEHPDKQIDKNNLPDLSFFMK